MEGDRVAVLASDISRATVRLSRILRSQQHMSVSLPQLSVLSVLERQGPMTPGELAGVERVKPPSMTRVLGLLENAGLIERTKHPTDGRQAIVAISTAGSALLFAERDSRERWLRDRIQTLPSEQQKTLRAAVGIIVEMSRD